MHLDRKLDFPAFGNPIIPTSAITFNCSHIQNSSPFFPSVFFLGARFVELLNLVFPDPPFPPVATTNFSLFLVKINLLDSVKQKKVYNILSNWIRAPGCSYIAFLGISEMYQFLLRKDYLSCFFLYVSNLLLFLNGTIYNFLTIRAFYLKISNKVF